MATVITDLSGTGEKLVPQDTHISSSPKKSNHQANIVRIDSIRPHPDPDTTNLELIDINEYQVVVRKGEFKVGDLAVYIQPDSVVPQTEPFRFIWNDHVAADGTVPEKRRRITVRKFRKEWSEGLLLRVTDFYSEFTGVAYPTRVGADTFDWVFGSNGVKYKVGDDVSDLLGITHYEPDTETEVTGGESQAAPRRKYPKTIKGWFFFLLHKLTGRGRKNYAQEVSFKVPTYDVESFKNHRNTFEEGELVVVTEKVHGSNARYLFLDGKMYAGSKNLWKAENSPCVWRKALKQNPWIEEWCRANEGYALYGEVTPTQEKYNYGCKKGEVKFFAFDVYSPEGKWLEYNDLIMYDLIRKDRTVPIIYFGPYDKESVTSYADGNSLVEDAKHIREGVVVKPYKSRHVRGIGRLSLKIVSNVFLDKDKK